MTSFSHVEARIDFSLLIGALAPYAFRALGSVVLTLCFKCGSGLNQNEFTDAMIGTGDSKRLSLVYIRTGRVSWTRASEIHKLDRRSALFVSIVRLVLWHWLQPLSYAFVLYAYWDLLDRIQIYLGVIVGFREILYFSLTNLCLFVNPAFLMVDLRATARYGSSWYVLQYVLSPLKYVSSTLIRTLLNAKSGNNVKSVTNGIWEDTMFNVMSDGNMQIPTTTKICHARSMQSSLRECCSEGFILHDLLMSVLVILDLSGILALCWAIYVDRVYVALIVGYAVTFIDGAFLFIYYMVRCCRGHCFQAFSVFEPVSEEDDFSVNSTGRSVHFPPRPVNPNGRSVHFLPEPVILNGRSVHFSPEPVNPKGRSAHFAPERKEKCVNFRMCKDVEDHCESKPSSETRKLQQWLGNVDTSEYLDLFIDHGFGDHFLDVLLIQEDDLKEMGITKVAHKRRLLAEIEKLRNSDALQSHQSHQGEKLELVKAQSF